MSAVPPSFLPQTSFSTLAQQPISSTGLPGSELDGEFARAADSINKIKSRLSEVQRDDGKLRNDVVSIESLSDDVRNLLASSSGTKPVTWSAGAQFAVGDLVSNPNDTPGTYLCITAHTSSTIFINDMSKWALIAAPLPVGVLYTNTFTGNGVTTMFTLTDTPASKNNTQVFIDGIYQPKGGYLLNGQILTITPAPSFGSDIEVSIGVPSGTSTVADGAISTTKLADEAVTTSKIFDLSVTSGKIANGAINTLKIQDATVTGVKLADAAVDSVKIAANAITQEKLAPNVAGIGPAFRAIASTGNTIQNFFPTKVNMTETFDTGSFFSSSRFTPLVPGYYMISGCVDFGIDLPAVRVYIYKNNARVSVGILTNRASSVSDLIYMNGTNDYIELFASQSSGTARNLLQSDEIFFCGYLARSA